MPFIPGYLDFRNQRRNTKWPPQKITNYHLSQIFGSRDEDETIDVVDYEKSDWYWQCTKPFPSAIETVKKLFKDGFNLFRNTSRQWEISRVAIAFLKAHFKSLKYFSDFGFGNRYPLNNNESHILKIEYCDRFSADLHIDDSLSEALFLARHGRTVILFDYQGKTAWNQCDVLPPNIIRVKSWPEVYQTIKRLTAEG